MIRKINQFPILPVAPPTERVGSFIVDLLRGEGDLFVVDVQAINYQFGPERLFTLRIDRVAVEPGELCRCVVTVREGKIDA